MLEPNAGWAYQTDLLEQGSLLLSAPGDYWSLRRQYFCKVVMLVLWHGDAGSVAVVLNRPTGLTTADVDLAGSQLPLEQPLRVAGPACSSDEWKVWFGGDCEGLELASGVPKHVCLHTLDRLAEGSREIIRGIYALDLHQARSFVERGEACKEDFLLLVGYTGWSPGQLQRELDQGGFWTLGAADQGLLLGLSPGGAEQPLTLRLEAACARQQATPGAAAVGDGAAHWERLFGELRPESRDVLGSEGEALNTEMIRRWVDLYLLPRPIQAAERASFATEAPLKAGMVLRGSGTMWPLGRPEASWPSRGRVDPWLVPGQYLHKAVLLLLEDSTRYRPATFVLLNGPEVGRASDGRPVLFGGLLGLREQKLLPLPGGGGIVGMWKLPEGVLQDLVELEAVSVAEGVALKDMLEVSPAQRWEAAGGTLASLAEAAEALQADEQRRKWFQEMLGMELGEG